MRLLMLPIYSKLRLLDFTPNFDISVGYTTCGRVLRPTYVQREATKKAERHVTILDAHACIKASDVTYQYLLKNIDLIWGIKGLIITRSNLVVTWKIRTHMNIISWFPHELCWFSPGGCIFIHSCHIYIYILHKPYGQECKELKTRTKSNWP